LSWDKLILAVCVFVMGVKVDGMEIWKPKCHLIWKSNPMGPVADRHAFLVEFKKTTITKRISFFEQYTVRKKVLFTVM